METGAHDDMGRVLVLTGGHPFDAESFFAMVESALPGRWDHVAHPAAVDALSPDRLRGYGAIVRYDMPGLEFTRADPPVVFHEPPASHRADVEAALERGVGMVVLHHALAAWPTWDRHAELVGGRFHYQPAQLRGEDWPDSGYRHDVEQTISVVDPEHPVCSGLPTAFRVTDEAYLCPVFEDDVVPLLRSDHRFEPAGFWSADLAIRGRRDDAEGWTHPPGSDLVGWATAAGRSPIVYLQFGDGPSAHRDPNVRRLLANAVDWVASAEARAWAAATSRSSG